MYKPLQARSHSNWGQWCCVRPYWKRHL